MLIKFTSGGRGGGAEIAAYLTAADREGRGHAPPEVVRGDMNRTRDLIDSIERKWSYTHGVLSFALEDSPSEAQQQEAMDAFSHYLQQARSRQEDALLWEEENESFVLEDFLEEPRLGSARYETLLHIASLRLAQGELEPSRRRPMR